MRYASPPKVIVMAICQCMEQHETGGLACYVSRVRSLFEIEHGKSRHPQNGFPRLRRPPGKTFSQDGIRILMYSDLVNIRDRKIADVEDVIDHLHHLTRRGGSLGRIS